MFESLASPIAQHRPEHPHSAIAVEITRVRLYRIDSRSTQKSRQSADLRTPKQVGSLRANREPFTTRDGGSKAAAIMCSSEDSVCHPVQRYYTGAAITEINNGSANRLSGDFPFKNRRSKAIWRR